MEYTEDDIDNYAILFTDIPSLLQWAGDHNLVNHPQVQKRVQEIQEFEVCIV